MSAPANKKTIKPLQGAFGSANSLSVAPKNPKYQAVKGLTKTGASAKNVKPKLDTTYELYKRIGRSTLSELLNIHSNKQESVYDLNTSDVLSVTTVADDDERKLKENLVDTDFLILDVRDPTEYEVCHIEGSFNYPCIWLRQDKYSPQVYSFKSKAHTIIIVYVTDESKAGVEAATLMTEKGFDNIYLLTGGLKTFGKKYPNWLFGTPPSDWKIEKAPLGAPSPSGKSQGGSQGGSQMLSPKSDMFKGLSRYSQVYITNHISCFSCV